MKAREARRHLRGAQLTWHPPQLAGQAWYLAVAHAQGHLLLHAPTRLGCWLAAGRAARGCRAPRRGRP